MALNIWLHFFLEYQLHFLQQPNELCIGYYYHFTVEKTEETAFNYLAKERMEVSV